MSPDGKTLAAITPVDGVNKGAAACELQIIDPVKMELRKDFTVPAAPYDVAVSDAGLVFVTRRRRRLDGRGGGGRREGGDRRPLGRRVEPLVRAAVGGPEAALRLQPGREAGHARRPAAARQDRRQAGRLPRRRAAAVRAGRRVPGDAGRPIPAVQDRRGAEGVGDARRGHAVSGLGGAVHGRGGGRRANARLPADARGRA